MGNRIAIIKGRIKTERVVKEFKSPMELKASLLNSLSQMDESARSDLLISNLLSQGRLRPLDGHSVLKQPGSDNSVYSEGVRLSFTLAHNGAGKLPVLLRGMTLTDRMHSTENRADSIGHKSIHTRQRKFHVCATALARSHTREICCNPVEFFFVSKLLF